jgi:hypothetical protein
VELDESQRLALNRALADLPRLSEERLPILQPLTDEELFACFIQVRFDQVDHIRARHPRSERTHLPSSHPVTAFELFMEWQTEREFREVFLHFVSRAVTDYWSHVTEGHPASLVSAEDYLRWLVERIRQDRSWWLRRQDRRVVRARGAPSYRDEP